MYQGFDNTGAKRQSSSLIQTFYEAISARAHIEFSAYLALTVDCACFGIVINNLGLKRWYLLYIWSAISDGYVFTVLE